MPTLLAVLHTQLTVILFEDAKRTEPFARLAKAPLQGASALGAVLQTPRAWWCIFKDVLFKRKAVGSTSWCVVCTAFINVLALLAISPLSSTLLTSEEVLISRPVDFTRIIPKDGVQLPLVADREAYFHTMAALMRNISTSAWNTDSSLPVIEFAKATVTVEQTTTAIISYELNEYVHPLDSAWSETSTIHDLSNSELHYTSSYYGPLNTTTS